MKEEPRKEHLWLQQLVGEWTSETECVMGPDQPPMKNVGTEVVTSLGGFWTIGEMEAQMAGCDNMKSIMTLGFDATKDRYVGTFVASMMGYFWVYSGSLDESGKRLVLDAEGPSFAPGGGMAKYQDIIEIISEDHRILSSQFQGADGSWTKFMTSHIRRKK